MKPIYQAQLGIQRVNIHEKDYPVLVNYLNDIELPNRIESILKQERDAWNNREKIDANSIRPIVNKAIASCLGRADKKVEIESDIWAVISQEAKAIMRQKNGDDIPYMKISVRKFDYSIMLIEKQADERGA